MRDALETRDWTEVARLLREEWSHRKKNAPGHLDAADRPAWSTVTRREGASAAKVCGAGGGGCVLFLVEPDERANASRSVIEREGATVLPVRVARRGVQIKPSISSGPNPHDPRRRNNPTASA